MMLALLHVTLASEAAICKYQRTLRAAPGFETTTHVDFFLSHVETMSSFWPARAFMTWAFVQN
jgi:hypothetical protein